MEEQGECYQARAHGYRSSADNVRGTWFQTEVGGALVAKIVHLSHSRSSAYPTDQQGHISRDGSLVALVESVRNEKSHENDDDR
jgi:hypothetical protein